MQSPNGKRLLLAAIILSPKIKKLDILVNLFGHGKNVNRTILLGAWGRVHEKVELSHPRVPKHHEGRC